MGNVQRVMARSFGFSSVEERMSPEAKREIQPHHNTRLFRFVFLKQLSIGLRGYLRTVVTFFQRLRGEIN